MYNDVFTLTEKNKRYVTTTGHNYTIVYVIVVFEMRVGDFKNVFTFLFYIV